MVTRRRECNPMIVRKDATGLPLARIPFEQKDFDEGFPQELMRRHPELLPVDEIEPAFAPLISIGREVPTPSGYSIDNLFINLNGYLTLAEAKLWRNPEARRQVLMQVIEYAKELAKWSYADLDSVVRAYNVKYRSFDQNLFQTISSLAPNFQLGEHEFVDRVARNLGRGRILLLVVGDGIRESAEELAQYVQQTPGLLYTLALVELQLYKWEEAASESYPVLPLVVARTVEIRRAVVLVEGADIAKVGVTVDSITEEPGERVSRRLLSYTDYIDTVRATLGSEDLVGHVERMIEDAEHRNLICEPKSASMMIKMKEPTGTRDWFTLFGLDTKGSVSVFWLDDHLSQAGLSPDIAIDFCRQSANLWADCDVKQTPKGYYTWTRYTIPVEEWAARYDEFWLLVDSTVDEIQSQAVDVRSRGAS